MRKTKLLWKVIYQAWQEKVTFLNSEAENMHKMLSQCLYVGAGEGFLNGRQGDIYPIEELWNIWKLWKVQSNDPDTKEGWMCSCTFICLCVVGRHKKVHVCLWEWKRVSEMVNSWPYSPIFFLSFCQSRSARNLSSQAACFWAGQTIWFWHVLYHKTRPRRYNKEKTIVFLQEIFP